MMKKIKIRQKMIKMAAFPGAGKPTIIKCDIKDFMPKAPSSQSQVITVKGRVSSNVKFEKGSKINRFNIVTINQGKRFQAIYRDFCPARYGDIISCFAVAKSPLTNDPVDIEIVDKPNIVTPCDRPTMIKTFINIFSKRGFGKSHGEYLYDKLEEYRKLSDIPESVNNVSRYLSYIVERWTKSGREISIRPLIVIFGQFLSQTPGTALWLAPPRGESRYTPDIRLARIMASWWKRNNDLRQLYLLGLNNTEIRESRMGVLALYDQLLVNPYVVASVPMKKCVAIDKLTSRQPYPTDELCGLITRAVFENIKFKRWTCTPKSWLIRRFPRFMEVKQRLQDEFHLVYSKVDMYTKPDATDPDKKGKFIYFRDIYESERKVLDWMVKNIQKEPHIKMGDAIYSNETIDEDQKAAVNIALKNNVSIITGPAGSGKTTVIKDLIYNLENNNVVYCCTSFTGRAVSRIKKVCNRPAYTIHRMIATADYVPLFKVLIMDEASMTSTGLLADLLETFNHDFQLILIGDPNQLPPIDWGSPFNAVIQSHSVPKGVLKTNHRVKAAGGVANGIITNTTRIAKWRSRQPFVFEPAPDFILKECTISHMIDRFKEFEAMGIKPEDFVVVTPLNKHIPKLNIIAQNIFNGEKPCVRCPDTRLFHIDDKVMMLKNDYDLDIMNGDEGVVMDIAPDKRFIFVKFDEKIVKIRISSNTNLKKKLGGDDDDEVYYSTGMDVEEEDDDEEDFERNKINTDYIQHSFIITTHKSQGGEWPIAIFYHQTPDKPNPRFYTRNLTYTGISRGKKLVTVAGSVMAISQTIGNSLPYCCDCFDDLLRSNLPRLYEEIIEDPFADVNLKAQAPDEYGYSDDDAPDFDW